MKNPKTTTIGILQLLTLFAGLVFVWFGKATFAEMGSYIGPLFSVLTSIGFIAAKDHHE
jgi:hypothetical protein